jgi:hypothetical protein
MGLGNSSMKAGIVFENYRIWISASVVVEYGVDAIPLTLSRQGTPSPSPSRRRLTFGENFDDPNTFINVASTHPALFSAEIFREKTKAIQLENTQSTVCSATNRNDTNINTMRHCDNNEQTPLSPHIKV